jgi:hypothetical protein
MLNRGTLISGAISLAAVVALTGCRFPYSFKAGGLIPAYRTIAVLPLDNRTNTPGLERELTEVLSNDLRRKLGLREAPEDRADVVVRGAITRYEPDIPVAISADPRRAAGTRRKLVVAVEVFIRNPASGRVIWERRGLPAEGEYAEGAEQDGRREAFNKLVNDIIQGVESQW